MSGRVKRDCISDVPEWSPLHGKAIRRVNARRSKNREATEKCIFDALTAIARRGGVHALKINNLAQEAKVSKELIYRYFGGLQGAIDLYIKRNIQTLENWPGVTLPPNATLDETRSFIKQIYRFRSELYYKNFDLRVIIRDTVFDLRHGKDRDPRRIRPAYVMLKNALSSYSTITEEQIGALDAVIEGAHAGLMLYMDCSSGINNIDLHSDTQREGIHSTIDGIIDDWMDRHISRAKEMPNKNREL